MIEKEYLNIKINDTTTGLVEGDLITLRQENGGQYDGDGFVTLTKMEFKELFNFLFHTKESK